MTDKTTRLVRPENVLMENPNSIITNLFAGKFYNVNLVDETIEVSVTEWMEGRWMLACSEAIAVADEMEKVKEVCEKAMKEGQ